MYKILTKFEFEVTESRLKISESRAQSVESIRLTELPLTSLLQIYRVTHQVLPKLLIQRWNVCDLCRE